MTNERLVMHYKMTVINEITKLFFHVHTYFDIIQESFAAKKNRNKNKKKKTVFVSFIHVAWLMCLSDVSSR